MGNTPANTTPTATPTSTEEKLPRKRHNRTAHLDRLLPQDIEAERAALGSMLLEREAIAEVVDVLRDAAETAFQLESHQHLYDVLVKLYFADQPIDDVLIKDELVRRDQWKKVGEYDFLGRLVSSVPSALRARHYATVVHEKHLLRQLVRAAQQVTERALDDDQPARAVLDQAEKLIFDVTEQRVSGQAQELRELLQEAFRTIERRGEDALTGEPTGFIEFDQLTCGLQRGELIIIAGRPSMGKTALGLNMAEHLAIRERRPTLFFSLEMSRLQLAQRILCSRARVNSHKLRRGRHSNEDLRRLQQVASDLSTAPLLVDDTSDLTVMELRARARIQRRRHPDLAAIFVDYLQLMRSPRSENRQVEVANISRGLKALAKDLNLPVVAMAQLNRGTVDKSRQGNRPRMSDLRESGAIEQDADVIALLHREAYYKNKEARELADEQGSAPPVEDPDENIAELIIDKQRNGPTGKILLHFNRHITRFDNHLPGGQAPEYVPAEADETPF